MTDEEAAEMVTQHFKAHECCRTKATTAAFARAAAALRDRARLVEAFGEISAKCEDKDMRPGAADKETLARRRLQALDYICKVARDAGLKVAREGVTTC